MSKLYSYITGEDIFKIDEDSLNPIIDKFLYKGQYALIVAEEKVGKTLLAQQIACSLSMGKPLFSKLAVSKPCKVWYMFNEVNENEFKDRFIRMRDGIEANCDNIKLIKFQFPFNSSIGKEQLDKILEENKGNYPDVLIVDALYKAVGGSLNENKDVIAFNSCFSGFANDLGGCARVMVHHMKKPSKDMKTGKMHKSSDKDSYGSAFITADIDHLFRLEKYIDGKYTERMLKCKTQRSGKIVKTLRLNLIEPYPLYFESTSVYSKEKSILVKFINKHKKVTFKQMMDELKVKDSKLHLIIGELKNVDRLVDNTNTRPSLYHMVGSH